jgi:phosphoenolpyruvate---glycerone phosphotransferase subunit DhaL
MITYIGSKEIALILSEIADKIHENVGYLTELDSQSGDGDHGANLDRGFSQLARNLSGFQGSDVGVLLEMAGTTLISSVGGASGPLFGTAIKNAGRVTKGKTKISTTDCAAMFEAAEAGVVSLGGAKVGDKTMLDSLHAATLAAKEAVGMGEADLVKVFESITLAAESGLEATKAMIARKGRAMYLGSRGLGTYDVGATSVCIILRSTLETLRRLDKTEEVR